MSIAILSTLEQADFTTEQARAITKVFEEDHQNLATKEDIRSTKEDIKSLESKMEIKMEAMESRIESKIESLEAKMVTKDEMNKLKYDILNWIVGSIILSGFLQMLFKYLDA